MSLIIPEEILQMAQVSEAELKLEIAIVLFQQKKINLITASQFAGINQLELQQILGHRNRTASGRNGSNLINAQGSQAEVLKRIEQRRTFSPTHHHLPDTLTLLQEDRAR